MDLVPGGDRRSITALLADIADNLRHMLRGELRLAARDLSNEAARMRSAALLCAAGAWLAALASVAWLMAAISALARLWPPWAAALAVGTIVAVAGGLIIAAGVRRFHHVHVPPEKTTERMKENIQWAKQHLN